MTVAIIVEVSGVKLSIPTHTPKRPAPTKPPILHIACMPDIIRRPEFFSTITA